MSRYLYVCLDCRKQIDKIFHHTQDVPETVACPFCGKQVTQFGKTVNKIEYVRAPSGAMKPKLSKGRKG